MREDNSFIMGVITTIIIVSSIWGIGSSGKYKGLTAKKWYDGYSECESSLYRYENALDEANSNIDELNQNVKNAKYSAWESYENMGNSLEDLETVNNIEP